MISTSPNAIHIVYCLSYMFLDRTEEDVLMYICSGSMDLYGSHYNINERQIIPVCSFHPSHSSRSLCTGEAFAFMMMIVVRLFMTSNRHIMLDFDSVIGFCMQRVPTSISAG